MLSLSISLLSLSHWGLEAEITCVGWEVSALVGGQTGTEWYRYLASQRERERESGGETGGLSGETGRVEEHHTGESPVRLHSPLHSGSFLSDDVNTMVAITINH